MIKPLRKRHLQVWRLWAVLLPLGIVAATLARKPMAKDSFALPQNGTTLPVIVAEKQVGKNSLQLRGSKSGDATQLLWINREPLKVASATIYLVKAGVNSIDSATYIGRIETRGNYVFALPSQADYHFLLYDFIHQQVIDRFSITPGEQSPAKPTNSGASNTDTKQPTSNPLS